MFYKILICLMLLAFAPAGTFAQTARQRYQSGMAMMNKGRWSDAIVEFKASKKLNKSPENIKNCDAQIAKCSAEMNKEATRRRQREGAERVAVTQPVVYDRIRLSTHELVVPSTPTPADCQVEVYTEPDGTWELGPIKNLTFMEDSWLLPQKVEGNKHILYFSITPNGRTEERTADVTVSYNSVSDVVHIRQQARPVGFDLSKRSFSLSRKEQSIVINISTNATKTYEETGHCWRVTNLPTWCRVRMDAVKVVKTTGEMLGGALKYVTSGGAETNSRVKVVGSTDTQIYIDVDENTGPARSGTIVIECQDVQRSVDVMQKKGK